MKKKVRQFGRSSRVPILRHLINAFSRRILKKRWRGLRRSASAFPMRLKGQECRTGHGCDGKVRGVTPRHARLAGGAASALVTFAFQTHLENPPSA